MAARINGNRGARHEISFNKVSKEAVPFQQELPI